MSLTTRKALASMEAGGVVFSTEVEPLTIQILDGMVVNSELCKCQHSEFTWYFAWEQKDNESPSDKAHQMVKAIRGRSR